MTNPTQPSALERHIQTGLTTIVAGLLIWVGVNMVELGKSTAVQSAQIASITIDVRDIKFSIRDRWTSLDHQTYANGVKEKFMAVERRFKALDK